MTFVKLYESILRSSIWLEKPSTKLVWITMLVLADRNGRVQASVGGLAHQAGVSREECDEAIRILSSPDPDSQSSDLEGRRIVRHDDGGWVIVNHGRYRERRTESTTPGAVRTRKYREKKVSSVDADADSGDASQSVTERHTASQGVTERHECHSSASASVSELEGVQGETLPVAPAPRPENLHAMVPCPSEPLSGEIFPMLVEKLGEPEEAIRAGIKEFVGYWTVGGGMGRTRTKAGWASACREHLRRNAERGLLKAPPSASRDAQATTPADDAKVEARRRAIAEAHAEALAARIAKLAADQPEAPLTLTAEGGTR